MSSNVIIKIRSDKTQTQLNADLLRKGRYQQLEAIKDQLAGLQGGAKSAVVEIPTAEYATGLVEVDDDGAQTVVIHGVTLTGGTDYAITGTVAQIAENLKNAINNEDDLKNVVEAEMESASVVKVTAKYPGSLGNLITTTTTGDATFGAVTLEDGADGVPTKLEFNLKLD